MTDEEIKAMAEAVAPIIEGYVSITPQSFYQVARAARKALNDLHSEQSICDKQYERDFKALCYAAGRIHGR